jgi:hypothetical protein
LTQGSVRMLPYAVSISALACPSPVTRIRVMAPV